MIFRYSFPHYFILRLYYYLLTFILTAIGFPSFAQSEHLSKKELRNAHIDSIYDRAEANSINTKGQLRYEYYFSNPSDDQLAKLGKKLEKDSFEIIEFRQIAPKQWRMVVMKNQVLSRETMSSMDKRFRILAYKFIVEKYNGFTIGNVRTNPLKIDEVKFVSYIKSLDNETLFSNATYLLTKESYDRAMVAFQECIDRHFKEDTSQLQMGNALVATNDLVKGIERWEAARNMNKHYLEAYLKLGDIFFENSHFNRSLYNYQEADTLKPNDDVILYKLASDLIEIKNYNESYKYAKRAVNLNHKNSYAKGLIAILKQPEIRKLRKKYPDQ
ncbi:MAG: ribonuclease E inhibitor RraB [Saprospiraceae bacterium]